MNETASELYIKVKEKKDEKEKERIENIKRLIQLIYSSRPEGTIYFARTPGFSTYTTEENGKEIDYKSKFEEKKWANI